MICCDLLGLCFGLWGTCLRTCWDFVWNLFGTFLGTCWDLFETVGDLCGDFGELFGNCLGLFWRLVGTAFETLGDFVWDCFWEFWENCLVLWGDCLGLVFQVVVTLGQSVFETFGYFATLGRLLGGLFETAWDLFCNLLGTCF